MAIPSSIVQISDSIWELPATYKAGMRIPTRIVASPRILVAMDNVVFEQVTYVATLPGIIGNTWRMPDGHWGYGFPIGGMAAMEPEQGVISPGGIGFDVNCGMRLVLTNLEHDEVQPRLEALVDRLFKHVPAGVGGTGIVKVSRDEFRHAVKRGSERYIDHGYGTPDNLEVTEEHGCVPHADATKVSDHSVERGYQQIGTLGSGSRRQPAAGGQRFELRSGNGEQVPHRATHRHYPIIPCATIRSRTIR